MWKDFNGNLLLDTRITFGGVAGCGSFGRPADIWKLIMKQQFKLIEVFRWVDDNLFVKNSEDNTTMIDVVNKSRVMGVATNEKKFSDIELYPGSDHEGYVVVAVPKGGDYSISYDLGKPVFFSTTK